MDLAITIIKNKLKQDSDLQRRTSMSIHHIIALLEFCIKSTYFLFQEKYFEQVHRTAMGWPICLIVANLIMEKFENKAINSETQPS